MTGYWDPTPDELRAEVQVVEAERDAWRALGDDLAAGLAKALDLLDADDDIGVLNEIRVPAGPLAGSERTMSEANVPNDPITKTGKVLHPWDIEAFVDEAEAGYDITHLLVKQRDAERALCDEAATLFDGLLNAEEASRWFLNREIAAINDWQARWREARRRADVDTFTSALYDTEAEALADINEQIDAHPGTEIVKGPSVGQTVDDKWSAAVALARYREARGR